MLIFDGGGFDWQEGEARGDGGTGGDAASGLARCVLTLSLRPFSIHFLERSFLSSAGFHGDLFASEKDLEGKAACFSLSTSKQHYHVYDGRCLRNDCCIVLFTTKESFCLFEVLNATLILKGMYGTLNGTVYLIRLRTVSPLLYSPESVPISQPTKLYATRSAKR
jgi:hypothetical protein